MRLCRRCKSELPAVMDPRQWTCLSPCRPTRLCAVPGCGLPLPRGSTVRRMYCGRLCEWKATRLRNKGFNDELKQASLYEKTKAIQDLRAQLGDDEVYRLLTRAAAKRGRT